VTPEASLVRAGRDLDEARMIAALSLARAAARSAYYAAFHAAEAFIVDRTGKIAKAHRGVHSEFARLIRIAPRTIAGWDGYWRTAIDTRSWQTIRSTPTPSSPTATPPG